MLDFKEQRIRGLTQLYYSKQEVQKAIFEFSRHKEVCPRYFEGFGKRPDVLQYPGDIFELVKKGATSFHCSEEIWQADQRGTAQQDHGQGLPGGHCGIEGGGPSSGRRRRAKD